MPIVCNEVDRLLIEFDKGIIFKFALTKFVFVNKPFINKAIRFGYIIYSISTEVYFFKNKVF